MSNRRRTWILAALVALAIAQGSSRSFADDPEAAAAPGGATPQAGTRLTEIQVAPDQGGTSVTLLANGPLAYQSLVLEKPDRLVIDLQGVTNRLTAHHFPVANAGVSRVRAGQYRTEPVPVTRVVFDLESKPTYQIESQGDRLVVHFVGAPPALELEQAQTNVASEDPVSQAAAEARAPALSAPAVSASSASRAITTDAMEKLLRAPALASQTVEAEAESAAPEPPSTYETRTIVTEETQYTGKKISLNLVDADVKQVFRLFHEISGLNFVLDPSVEGRVTIVLDQVPWDQALDIILNNNGLDKQLENNVVRIAPTQKLATEAASRRQLKEAKELEVEPITITRTLSYAKSKDVERVIRDGGVLSSRGKVIVDERTNTLIISDIPKRIEPLDQLISSLDSETPQVMIEARIVETSRQFVQDFGVRWGFAALADASRGTATSLSFPHNASMRYGLNLPGGGGASALNFKFGNVLDSFTLDVTLHALESEGRGRVLSSPKIATQNNERAEIEQGVRIPVVNTTATEINVEFVSASLRLSVTPQITAEGTIILDIEVENNSPDFVNRVGSTPPINTQRAQTKLLVSDGGTTVIGGIFTVNESQSESGVPWFRKIPVFGWLFKARNITNENRELLIFITPKVMRVS